MAKRRKSRSVKTEWYRISGGLSFTAIFLSGTITIINLILNKIGDNFYSGTLNTIVKVCLFLGVIIPSFLFLESTRLPGKKIIWEIIFILFIVLLFIGVIGISI